MVKKGKALRLTVTLYVADGEPGGASRMAKALSKVGKMLETGSTAGEIEEWFEYSQGGQPERDRAEVTYEMKRINAADLD